MAPGACGAANEGSFACLKASTLAAIRVSADRTIANVILLFIILWTGVITFLSAHSQARPARERVDTNFNLMPFTVPLQIGRIVTNAILAAQFESNGCGGVNYF